MTREEILHIAKPILFNGYMVRAILDGRKTATRRKIDIDIINFCDIERDETLIAYQNADGDFINPIELCRYQKGDYLYVRESFRIIDFSYVDGDWNASVQYRADESIGTRLHMLPKGADEKTGWRPSIHMPKQAARIFFRVTDVSVERLNDMKLDDFISEGVILGLHEFEYPKFNTFSKARNVFSDIWDSTIPKKDMDKYGWEVNPWVWAIEFGRVEV